MLVSEIGEFGLIRLLAEEFGLVYPPRPGALRRPGLLVDLGDDALVTQRREGALIWTTDTMVAEVHFLPSRTSWEAVGWKALAVNISDIAAMGGRPDLALVTLCLPPDYAVEDAQALYRGLHAAAKAYGVTLGGGDIVRAPVFSITVALSGWAHSSRLGGARALTRDSARIGELVAVSGTLGDSAGGLSLLREGGVHEDAAGRALIEAHERPQPRVGCGLAAIEAGARCGIDISDGLVQDLGHIARASNVGIRIELSRLPMSEALLEVFPSRAAGFALSGGEDYQLAIVAPRPVMEALLAGEGCDWTQIGEVVAYDEPRVVVVDQSGREVPLRQAGWDHLNAP